MPSPSSKRSTSRQSVSRAGALRIPKIHALLVEHRRKWLRNPNTPLWSYKSIALELETAWANIRDDIRHMRDVLGYPITFIPEKHGHMYLEDFTPVSTELLTPGDLTTLCFMMRAMEPFRQNPDYRKRVRSAITKISATLREELGISFRDLEKAVTFRSTGVDAHVDPAIFETVFAAVLSQRELVIDYIKLNNEEETGPFSRAATAGMVDRDDATTATKSDHSAPPRDATPVGRSRRERRTSPIIEDDPSPRPPANSPTANPSLLPIPLPPPERRKVEPLHLLCFDNVWYLYVWDQLRRDIRRFALNRMQSAERTGRTFKRRKFDIEEQLAGTLGVTSGTPQDTHLRFKGRAVRIVTERFWHESQKFTPTGQPEWPLEMTLHVAHTPELESFVQHFGDDVEVLQPAELHDAIVAKAQRIIARTWRTK